jgi:hypothetical protein
MKPRVAWKFDQLPRLARGREFNSASGEGNTEAAAQKAREKKVLTARYYYEQDVPPNPSEKEELCVTVGAEPKFGIVSIDKEV